MESSFDRATLYKFHVDGTGLMLDKVQYRRRHPQLASFHNAPHFLPNSNPSCCRVSHGVSIMQEEKMVDGSLLVSNVTGSACCRVWHDDTSY